jgi:hypothetical protein
MLEQAELIKTSKENLVWFFRKRRGWRWETPDQSYVNYENLKRQINFLNVQRTQNTLNAMQGMYLNHKENQD